MIQLSIQEQKIEQFIVDNNRFFRYLVS